jgi:carbon-monoxide dehydrogenase large subunit
VSPGPTYPDTVLSSAGLDTQTSGAWIGRRMRRREDPRLVTGRGRYASDYRPEGLAYMAVVRAGAPRGRVARLDLEAARAMPGVIGAWTAADLGLARGTMPEGAPLPDGARPRPVLAADAVCYAGDALAVLAAETEYQVHDAAATAFVELEPLDPEPAPAGMVRARLGDVDGAFGGAAVAVRERLKMGKICGAALEPRAVTAEWDEASGTLTIRASVGWVHGLRDAVAACLGLDPDHVVALVEDVGGSFGAKNSPYPEYILAAAIARRLRRPVRWVATRSEDGHTTGQAHGTELDLEVAADADGRLRGIRGLAIMDVGAYIGRGANQAGNYSSHLVSAYRLPALQLDVEQRFSTGPPAAHIRGGGRPVGNFGIERMMDRLARRLGMEPAELRRRNLIQPGQMPYDTGLPAQVYDGGDYPRLLDLATERMDVPAVRRRQAAGEPIGFGLALCVESTGIAMPETSRVQVRPDGTAVVVVGSAPQGQGHQTFVAQVAADRLGWDLDRIEVRLGDSRAGLPSAVTAGSRSALEVGNSVALSAAGARRALVARAAELLEADAADLELTPAGASVRGVPGRLLPLAELVGPTGIEATETWDSRGAKAWASSCHAALVGVDVETGGVSMLRYVIAHDSGRAINPLLLEGQLHGGYAHGLGYALFEEAVYQEDGTFLSPSFLDYAIVSAPELRCEPELIHTETPSSHNPESFRGVGEAGTIAVPAAIANAVEDALFHLGRDVAVNEIPITPERLLRLLS